MMSLLLCLGAGSMNAQNFRFKELLSWMDFNYQGKTIQDYKAYGKSNDMDLIFEKEAFSETYLVYGKGLTYSRADDIEMTFSKTAEDAFGLELDLTPNVGNYYNPITITVIFKDRDAQQKFRQDGLKMGCIENDDMQDTNFGLDWKNVTGIKYNAAPKVLTTWRFVYFYEKDGLFMATFQ